jgi:hypothetical protein
MYKKTHMEEHSGSGPKGGVSSNATSASLSDVISCDVAASIRAFEHEMHYSYQPILLSNFKQPLSIKGRSFLTFLRNVRCAAVH